jgi:hypothetical protein
MVEFVQKNAVNAVLKNRFNVIEYLMALRSQKTLQKRCMPIKKTLQSASTAPGSGSVSRSRYARADSERLTWILIIMMIGERIFLTFCEIQTVRGAVLIRPGSAAALG